MNANDLFKAVMDLDLEPIKTKLMHVQSGEGWSPAKTVAVEKEYRRFLCLMKLYPHENTAPLVDVDTFWHYHILDTMKYAVDCEQVFGHFLHHYPYVGMRGANDDQFRVDSGMRMRQLYEATFGDAYPVASTFETDNARPAAFVATSGVRMLGDRAGSISANTAFCGGPDRQVVGASTAFCGGPDSKAISAGTAFCGGPDSKAISAGTAFCGGPDSKAISASTAFCGGPDSKAISASTAFCGGPDSKAISAGIAFCGGPDSKAINASTAFCGGPDSKTYSAGARPVIKQVAYCISAVAKPGASVAANTAEQVAA